MRAAHTAVNNARAQVKQAESEANSLFTQQLQSTDTNEIMRLRQAVADATTRAEAAKLAVTDAEDALGKLEEEARQAGIPPGWLRDDDRSSP